MFFLTIRKIKQNYRLLDKMTLRENIQYFCVKKGKVVPLRSIKAHLGERRYSSYPFVNLGTRRGWVVRITPRPRFTPGTHSVGGRVGPRAGLDAEVRGKILCLCRGSNPGRPVRSQTLNWLSYPGSSHWRRFQKLHLRYSKSVCLNVGKGGLMMTHSLIRY
jgi:hypothetical protein